MTSTIDVLTTRSIDLLSKLVTFNSVSHDSNLPIIRFIEDYLTLHHVPYERIPSPDGQKTNLLAHIGAEAPGGILLSGHTDVVPITGQIWDTDPFSLTEKNGKLYGRGSCDMKGFIAVCLAMLPEFVKAQLPYPLYFAFSYDEEIGCLGVPDMAKRIQSRPMRPDFAIIGEPTGMQVVTAHKGVFSFETTVYGLEGHSSQPQRGVNAVHYGCRLVNYLLMLGEQLQQSGMKDSRFDPSYSTLHVGIMEGGTARNIIPKECYIHWEIRPLPGDDVQAIIQRIDAHCRMLEAEMRNIHPEAAIVSKPMSRMAGVTLPAHASAACHRVKHYAITNEEHAVSFGTEAGVFNEHGIPSIICGPGSIEQAHKPNEFIDINEIKKCVEFMIRLMDDF